MEGRNGIAENREENQIIYLTTILEAKRNFNDV
jgi:hypothetical protein